MVAADVGLTKPRFYFHFESKQEMLKACIERALCQWKTAIDEIEINRFEPSREAIRSVVERYADVAFGDFGMCLMRGDVEYLDDDVEDLDVKERDMLLRQKADVDVGFKGLIAEALSRQPQFCGTA
jgi:AcrR family transcriptional regulator